MTPTDAPIVVGCGTATSGGVSVDHAIGASMARLDWLRTVSLSGGALSTRSGATVHSISAPLGTYGGIGGVSEASATAYARADSGRSLGSTARASSMIRFQPDDSPSSTGRSVRCLW